MNIPLEKIKANPYQPRTDEDVKAIEEIAINIYRNGLMQIPSARAVNGHYELVFGHTRKAAYELLATKGVPSADIKADKAFALMPLNIHDLSDRQMFEMAVAENIKRRDLNSIETAQALQTYMKDFSASSKEAGELFGLNDATVRGKVRLLDLPKEAQTQLADGKISEGTARTLLSMQKVASAEDVTKVISKLIKSDGKELPDDVIEEEIQSLKNVIDLFNENYRNGEPTAGHHGWPLAMKKFPNQHLPAMSVEAVAANEKHIDHLINPPACNACPFYTKVRGSHFCGLKICYERKFHAWGIHAVETASKKTKIEIYTDTDGPYRFLSYGDGKLFEKRHEGLRLMSPNGRSVSQYFSGLDDDLVVVAATGKALSLLSSSSSSSNTTGGKKTEKEKAEMRALKIYRVRRKELLWEFTLYAKSIFDAVPLEVLKRISGWEYIPVDQRPPTEEPSEEDAVALGEYLRRLIIWKIVDDDSSSFSRAKLSEILPDLEDHAKLWKVKLPAALRKNVDAWDVEIKEAATVSTATKAKK